MQGAQVRSLVRELRSHMPCGVAINTQIKMKALHKLQCSVPFLLCTGNRCVWGQAEPGWSSCSTVTGSVVLGKQGPFSQPQALHLLNRTTHCLYSSQACFGNQTKIK